MLDSVSLNQLLRVPKKVRKARQEEDSYETALDEPMRNGELVLAIDPAGGIVDEWRDTCGWERVQVVINHWESYGSLKVIKPVPNFGNHHWNALRQLGFDDTIDKLMLRIASATIDRTVVSDDSDFWDPSIPGARGDDNSPVAQYCRNSLQITIEIIAVLIAGF